MKRKDWSQMEKDESSRQCDSLSDHHIQFRERRIVLDSLCSLHFSTSIEFPFSFSSSLPPTFLTFVSNHDPPAQSASVSDPELCPNVTLLLNLSYQAEKTCRFRIAK